MIRIQRSIELHGHKSKDDEEHWCGERAGVMQDEEEATDCNKWPETCKYLPMQHDPWSTSK